MSIRVCGKRTPKFHKHRDGLRRDIWAAFSKVGNKGKSGVYEGHLSSLS